MENRTDEAVRPAMGGAPQEGSAASQKDAGASAGGRRERRIWQPRWYMWDGGFLALGRSTGTVPPHAHHAIQITVALDGTIAMTAGDVHAEGQGLITAPDVQHLLEMRNAFMALLFVDPESHEGRWLGRSLEGPLTRIPPAKLEACTTNLQSILNDPLDGVETARLIHTTVRNLCTGPAPARHPDARVTRALELIREMDTRKISLEEVAASVFLSPSRFAHIFSEVVGLPFRRYVLWRRLTRAIIAVGRGKTLTAAAHSCGFSDSAHLTRACAQMFGNAPSVVLGPGEFYEIPAPFELPTARSQEFRE